MGKYAYVMDLRKDTGCLVAESDLRLEVPQIMMLMLENNADSCDVYETNNSKEIEDWTFVTTFGGLMTSF